MTRFEMAVYSLLLVFLVLAYLGRNKAEQITVLPNSSSALVESADTAKALIRSSYNGKTYPLIFEASFHDSTTAAQDALTLNFNKLSLGYLKCESGVITACDPINLEDTDGFAQLFPTGNFPVELAMARFDTQERVAFSRILFSSNPVVKWQLAHGVGQKPLALDAPTTYCYGVDSGTGLFIDKVAKDVFAAKGQTEWEDVFIAGMQQNGNRGYLYSFDGHSLATFSSGLGDGCYSTYIGYDSAGKVCRLLTDFELVNW